MPSIEDLKNKKLFEDLLWNKAFEEVEEILLETGHWQLFTATVLKHKESGTFYRVLWRQPATLQQKQEADYEIHEVIPVIEERVVFKDVNKGDKIN